MNQAHASRALQNRGLSTVGGALAMVALATAALGTPGCAGGERPEPDHMKGVAAAERAAASTSQPVTGDMPPAREQPVALANGISLGWDDLRPMLAEAAGGQVVQEALLDRLLVAECKNRGLVISEEHIAAERKLLMEAIVRDAKATPDDAERLLENIRRSRGLGEVRFGRLLERNARLRLLVAPTVEVSEADVVQAFEMLHGEKCRVRIILTPGQGAVAAARDELAQAQDQLSARFAAQAIKVSADPSAERGGLLEPFSSADPAYPSSVREALGSMQPGQISPVLAVDRGYAIMLLEERIPADGVKLGAEAATIAAEVRTRRERQAMDAMGLGLIRGSGLRVLDRSLEWSLNAARSGAQR